MGWVYQDNCGNRIFRNIRKCAYLLGQMLTTLVFCNQLAFSATKESDNNSDQQAEMIKSSFVAISAYCPHEHKADIYQQFTGFGVEITSNYVLTVAHIFKCKKPALIIVTLPDGTRVKSHISRIEYKVDIAKLEPLGNHNYISGFKDIPLEGSWVHSDIDFVCIPFAQNQVNCAHRLTSNLVDITLHKGSSGSGAFDNGRLIGLVSTYYPERGVVEITIVPTNWMDK